MLWEVTGRALDYRLWELGEGSCISQGSPKKQNQQDIWIYTGRQRERDREREREREREISRNWFT